MACEPTWNGSEPREREQSFRIAPKLARQIAHRPGAAKRHAQEQLSPIGEAGKLAHFVGIVRHEGADAELERIDDVPLALDRMGMDAAGRIAAQPLHELHFPGRGEIQEAALPQHGLDDGRMWHGLQCVMQIDPRERLLELAVLHAHPLAIEHQQRRPELLHEPADLGRLEGINEARTAHGCLDDCVHLSSSRGMSSL
jgi:hypothetical protein